MKGEYGFSWALALDFACEVGFIPIRDAFH
jgi:hypothetical protein